jgi:hypothetical protein
MKKFITLFLIFSILLLSGNIYAKERKGADLIIQKVNGIRERGELIAVKQDSILLLDKYSGEDMAIDFRDIGDIKIVRKARVLATSFAGLIVGAGVGYAIGYPQGSERGFLFSKDEAGAIGAGIGGVLCALMGATVAMAFGTDKTIQVQGKSDSQIQEIMEKLRKKARIKNYE